MGLLIGMDEAGYGPNLGPLVITATAWEVPGDPGAADLYRDFRRAVVRDWKDGERRVHVADSKRVYSPRGGLQRLERGVLAGLGLRSVQPSDYRELCRFLTGDCGAEGAAKAGASRSGSSCTSSRDAAGPWCEAADLPLPVADGEDGAAAQRWKECCQAAGIQLRDVHSEIVWPRRWNRLLAEHGNKSNALTRLSLQLLRRVWQPADDRPALVVGDKHGGRNRYDPYLQEIAEGEMILRLRESKRLSRYRIGSTEFRFQMQGESHLPVALSSMICKYVRELSMVLFNRFWSGQQAGLKPTKGYPADAKRFRRDIAETQRRLGIPDEVLWRAK